MVDRVYHTISGFSVTCECNEEEINDDDDDRFQTACGLCNRPHSGPAWDGSGSGLEGIGFTGVPRS